MFLSSSQFVVHFRVALHTYVLSLCPVNMSTVKFLAALCLSSCAWMSKIKMRTTLLVVNIENIIEFFTMFYVQSAGLPGDQGVTNKCY